MNEQNNYLKNVREQYENFPYPQRNPSDEKKRLISYENQSIELINHYCFNGSMNLYPKGIGTTFKILIAGGGTGDAAIYYAEILYDLNVEITYLDMSKSSSKIAKERAKTRQLKNIKWLHHSILDLPNIDIGKFDYIDCSGVLHHLESPSKGLIALKSVLKNNGAMNVMVYAKYGRTGVYQMQELMKKINTNEENLQIKIDNTKTIINNLPATNWFEKSKEFFTNDINNDNGIYDLLLHSQDRSYNITELYNWIEDQCNLNIIEFNGSGVESKIGYDPKIYIKDTNLLLKIKKLPDIEQKAISELLSGFILKHSCFISENTDTIASYKDLDLIPYIYGINANGKDIAEIIRTSPKHSITFTIAALGSISLKPTKYTEQLFKYMNGERSLKEIFNKIEASEEELFLEYERIYKQLFDLNIILLKSKKFPNIKNISEAQTRVSKIYNLV